MFENFSATNTNFYNYILSKQKYLNTQKNFSQLNIFKTINPLNSTEIKGYNDNLRSSEIYKNIKVNKIKFDVLNDYNTILAKTNRDLFHNTNSVSKRNKRSNLISDNFNTINYNNSNNNSTNDIFFSYQKQKRKNNIIYTNNDNNLFDTNLYNISLDSGIKNSFKRNKSLKNNLFSEKKREINYSKIIYNFKNMKMFYAHLELLISLYLKRNYKYFIEQINRFVKIKNNLNVYNTINNQNQPIINLNNAHCSLYYSININKDLNNNNTDIYNKNNKYMKTFFVNKNIVNNMENINYILNTENKINMNKKNKSNNKTIYVPKNKTSKLKKIKANKAKNKNSNNIRKSSPIKEMSIDLKKMNLNANKTNNNLKNEKNKLKFANSKKNIYKKPNDNNKKSQKIIKEIKIQKKEIILTPQDYKTKKCFENNKKNNTIKKIYIRNNNNNDTDINNDIIKTTLFRSNSDLSYIKYFSNFLKNKPEEILVKKIITSDKRIYININYVILDTCRNNVNTSKAYLNLNTKHILSLTIIKNTLLILENFNQNMIFSDIFIFDNDKSKFSVNVNNIKKEEKNNKNISILNLAQIIKDNIIKTIRKYILNKYKKYLYLKNVIIKKNNKILSYYFKKFYVYNKTKSKIYHKINYNDDFNINKKINPLTIKKKNNNILNKINQNNLISKNNNNVIYRNKNKSNKNIIQSSTNFSRTHKYWNKDINITVHEIKDKDINKKKNIISSYNKK